MIKYYLKDDEYFYGGAVNDGTLMPFNKDSIYEINLFDWHSGNQAAGLLFSNLGNIFYCEHSFKFGFYKGELYILDDDVKHIKVEPSLRKTHQYICKNIFKSCPKTPDEAMFIHPQFNTWIEMGQDVTQEKVLKYAQDIISHGYKPGVLMIDDRWSVNYAIWEFDKSKFSNPKAMIDKLHEMGFKVVLWICPFIDFENQVYFDLLGKDMLVKTSNGEVFHSHWWNGESAVLDFTNPDAVKWIKDTFDRLIKDYGVDGFKLDAGDPEWYRGDAKFKNSWDIASQARSWCEIGEQYNLSELRVAFNNGISPIAHRLRDKYHSWNEQGINTLIPNSIMMGLMGYPFLCPDMIGGGTLPDFERDDFYFDEELYVRYAQVAALLPMMQFSLAPWKCLNLENQKYVQNAVNLHEKYSKTILSLLNKAKLGEPIIRSLAYQFEDDFYMNINDEFMLGENILVAPQIKKENKRKVVIPNGEWQDEFGKIYHLGEYEIDTPLSRLPIFTRIDKIDK